MNGAEVKFWMGGGEEGEIATGEEFRSFETIEAAEAANTHTYAVILEQEEKPKAFDSIHIENVRRVYTGGQWRQRPDGALTWFDLW